MAGGSWSRYDPAAIAATSGCSSPHAQKSGALTSSHDAPLTSAADHGAEEAARIDRSLRRMGRAARLPGPLDRHGEVARATRIGTGASRMSDPLAAASWSTWGSIGLAGPPEPLELPAHGHPDVEAAPVRRQVAVIAPEQVPAQLVGEVEPAACRAIDSARHSAIDVSSVHSPAANRNGPPPTMSVIGSNVPGARNSTVVPTASPQARPTSAPRARSRSATTTRPR